MAHEYLLPFALPTGQTGQAVNITASVMDSAGVALGAQPAYNIREVGSGFYFYVTTAMPDGQVGVVRIIFGGATIAVGAVAPRETEYTGMLPRVAGLLGENMVIEPTTYDSNGNMTAGVIYLYDTAAHAATNDHTTGLVASYANAAVIASGLLSKGTLTRTT